MFILETPLKLTVQIWPGTIIIVKYFCCQNNIIQYYVQYLEREKCLGLGCCRLYVHGILFQVMTEYFLPIPFLAL